MGLLAESQRAVLSSAIKVRSPKVPGRVIRPAWDLIEAEIIAMRPGTKSTIPPDDFDLRHLEAIINVMHDLVDLTHRRVPKRVRELAWSLVHGEFLSAQQADDTDYLESVVGVAEQVSIIMAERPRADRPQGTSFLSRSLICGLRSTISACLQQAKEGNGPATLPAKSFVDLERLNDLIGKGKLLSDISGKAPPTAVGDAAWGLVQWHLESITPNPTSAPPPNDPGHPGRNHPGFSATA